MRKRRPVTRRFQRHIRYLFSPRLPLPSPRHSPRRPNPRALHIFLYANEATERIIRWERASSLRFHIAIIGRYSRLFYSMQQPHCECNKICKIYRHGRRPLTLSLSLYNLYINIYICIYMYAVHPITGRHKLLLHFAKYYRSRGITSTILFITRNDTRRLISGEPRELHNDMQVSRTCV